MGGEVLELLNDRAARLEREAEARGLKQGIEQGIERGVEDLSARLKARGLDEALIDEVVASMKRERQ